MDFIWETGKAPQTSITEQIKINRDISQDFLDPSLAELPEIDLLKDLERSAERILKAVRSKERIMIYGHDDMDGITSTYILFDYLEKIGSQNHYYQIPNRLKDSHGIKQGFIDKIERMGIELLITVDGGISEFDAIEKINKLGCEVIVTDHHIVQGKVPDAYTVVNPKQSDCDYPFKMVAGVAISYFLVMKLAEITGINPDRDYLFWVAVGSISDKVPMRGVNRILIKKVLDQWNIFSSEKLLLLDGNFNSARNHSSRMKVIRNIIKLLSSLRDDNGMILSLSVMLNKDRSKLNNRNKLQEEYSVQEQKLNQVKEWLLSNFSEEFSTCFVYYDKDNQIPVEFLGVCATHISKTYLIPAVFLKKKSDIISCEARCTAGFDLIKAFRNCNDTLIQYGGHKQAAGFTMHEENTDQFISCFKNYVKSNQDIIDKNRKLYIDAVIDTDKKDELEQFIFTDYHFLQPYGEENPTPLILLKNFNSETDKQFLDLIRFQKIPDPDKVYDLVLKIGSTSAKVHDIREINN